MIATTARQDESHTGHQDVSEVINDVRWELCSTRRGALLRDVGD